jgi:hypothetical protein
MSAVVFVVFVLILARTDIIVTSKCEFGVFLALKDR